MNAVFPLADLPKVREQWLRGVSAAGIARYFGRSPSVVQDIVRHNTVGNQWPENNLELPVWIDAV